MSSPATPAQATPIAGNATATPAQQTLPLEGSAQPQTKVDAPVDAVTTKTDTVLTEPEAQTPVVPESYDLKLPEGALLQTAQIEKIAQLAKEQGFTQVQAQKFAEEQNALLTNFIKTQEAQYSETRQSWRKAVESDKEMGGQQFKQTAELARRVVDRFGSPALKDALNQSGLGDHPELVRFVAKIGKEMADHQFFQSPGTPAPKKDAAAILYGSTEQ